MLLPKAKEILDELLRTSSRDKSSDSWDALKIASHAISRILTMRSYGINQAILPLPGERPIPDLSPSADRKQSIRESSLGREPRH